MMSSHLSHSESGEESDFDAIATKLSEVEPPYVAEGSWIQVNIRGISDYNKKTASPHVKVALVDSFFVNVKYLKAKYSTVDLIPLIFHKLRGFATAAEEIEETKSSSRALEAHPCLKLDFSRGILFKTTTEKYWTKGYEVTGTNEELKVPVFRSSRQLFPFICIAAVNFPMEYITESDVIRRWLILTEMCDNPNITKKEMVEFLSQDTTHFNNCLLLRSGLDKFPNIFWSKCMRSVIDRMEPNSSMDPLPCLTYLRDKSFGNKTKLSNTFIDKCMGKIQTICHPATNAEIESVLGLNEHVAYTEKRNMVSKLISAFELGSGGITNEQLQVAMRLPSNVVILPAGNKVLRHFLATIFFNRNSNEDEAPGNPFEWDSGVKQWVLKSPNWFNESPLLFPSYEMIVELMMKRRKDLPKRVFRTNVVPSISSLPITTCPETYPLPNTHPCLLPTTYLGPQNISSYSTTQWQRDRSCSQEHKSQSLEHHHQSTSDSRNDRPYHTAPHRSRSRDTRPFRSSRHDRSHSRRRDRSHHRSHGKRHDRSRGRSHGRRHEASSDHHRHHSSRQDRSRY